MGWARSGSKRNVLVWPRHQPRNNTTSCCAGMDRRQRSALSPRGSRFNDTATILEQLAEPKKMAWRRAGFLVGKGSAAREGAEILDPESGEGIGKISSRATESDARWAEHCHGPDQERLSHEMYKVWDQGQEGREEGRGGEDAIRGE
jgi:hypothetical protein